jgi:tryptophan synthase alpha chain
LAEEIDTIFLVAPSSTDERIKSVVASTSGFVYAASTMGVTGARSQVGGGAEPLVTRTRRLTGLPIAVGLGVSTGAQAREVAAYADGVIVGSAFVRCIRAAPDLPGALAAVRGLAGELAEGVRR